MYDSYNSNNVVETDREEKKISRPVNRSFKTPVYIWYSAALEAEDGTYRIYETRTGKLLKGTTHSDTHLNPYPNSVKDAVLVGRASLWNEVVLLASLYDDSDAKKKEQAFPEGLVPPDQLCMCDLISLSSIILKQMLAASGMAHED